MNQKKRSVPAFATEAEDAAWWYMLTAHNFGLR